MWKLRRFWIKESISELNRSERKMKAIKTLEKKYDFLAVIGSGAYGDIIVFWSKQEKKTVAAKIVDPTNTSKGELKLWPRLNHRNIVPVFKIRRYPNVDIFLMPYYSESLKDIFEGESFRRNPQSFRLMTEWLTDILSGLEYLHASDICHLDLKADNILITTQKVAVIGDFSSIEQAKDPTDGYTLPRLYCPPEAWPLDARSRLPKVDGKAFDIWSFGMIIFNIFTDCYLEANLGRKSKWWDDIFPQMTKCLERKVYYNQLRNAFPCNFPKMDTATCAYSMNLIKGVLRYKPENRPNPSTILRHIILHKTRSDLLEPSIMWTYRKEEIQKLLLKDRINSIIKKAALQLEEDENRKLSGVKKKFKHPFECNPEVSVPSISEYFCCCCQESKTTKQK